MAALMTLSGMDRASGKALSGPAHIRQSIADILTTPLGSRLCNRNYGSNLPNLVDAPLNDEGRQQIFAATATAIAQNFPQIMLTHIALTQPQAGEVSLTLTALERGANTIADPIITQVRLNSLHVQIT